MLFLSGICEASPHKTILYQHDICRHQLSVHLIIGLKCNNKSDFSKSYYKFNFKQSQISQYSTEITFYQTKQ